MNIAKIFSFICLCLILNSSYCYKETNCVVYGDGSIVCTDIEVENHFDWLTFSFVFGPIVFVVVIVAVIIIIKKRRNAENSRSVLLINQPQQSQSQSSKVTLSVSTPNTMFTGTNPGNTNFTNNVMQPTQPSNMNKYPNPTQNYYPNPNPNPNFYQNQMPNQPIYNTQPPQYSNNNQFSSPHPVQNYPQPYQGNIQTGVNNNNHLPTLDNINNMNKI